MTRDAAARLADHIARLLLAIFGSYLMAAVITASLSLLPLMPRAEMVLTATLLSFAIYCANAIWAFCAGTALRAWLASLLLTAPFALHLLSRSLSA